MRKINSNDYFAIFILLLGLVFLSSCNVANHWEQVYPLPNALFRYQESTRSLWVVDEENEQIIRISSFPSDEATTEMISVPGNSPIINFCVSENGWVITRDNVYEIDLKTNEITERYGGDPATTYYYCNVFNDGSVNILSYSNDLSIMYEDVESEHGVLTQLPVVPMALLMDDRQNLWAITNADGIFRFSDQAGWEKWSGVSGTQMEYLVPNMLWTRSGKQNSIVFSEENVEIPQAFLDWFGSLAEDYTLVDQTPDGVIWISNQKTIYKVDGENIEEINIPQDCHSVINFQVVTGDNGYLIFLSIFQEGIYLLKLPDL